MAHNRAVLAPYLIGPLVAVVGLVALFLTLRTRARVRGKSMYASAREERARKVLAARESVMRSLATQPEIGTLPPEPSDRAIAAVVLTPPSAAAPGTVAPGWVEAEPEPVAPPADADVMARPWLPSEPEGGTQPEPEAQPAAEAAPAAEPEPADEPPAAPSTPFPAAAPWAAPEPVAVETAAQVGAAPEVEAEPAWLAVPLRGTADPSLRASVEPAEAASWEIVPQQKTGHVAPAPEPAADDKEPKGPAVASTVVSYVVLGVSLVVILLGIVLMIATSRG